MKTQLNDRVLWFDGTSQVRPDLVPDLFLMGVPQDKIMIKELNDDISLFNEMADHPLATTKNENDPLDLSWNVTPVFLDIDLEAYLDRVMEIKMVMNPVYKARVAAEMAEIKKRKLEPLFLTLIYIISTLKREGKVWGVGRGSSCASLILNLIGVHEVDPIRFNIPLTEFFHD